jgi:hypothetical protein
MAKTIDDLIVEISKLVNTLNNKNSGGGGGGTPSAPNTGNQSEIFESLFNEFNHLKDSVKKTSKRQEEYANALNKGDIANGIKNLIEGYTDANGEVIQGLKELNNSFGAGAAKFNDDVKYYEKVAQTMNEQNSIIQDINVRKANLFGLEQKLLNDKLKVEEAELAAREENIEKLEEFSEIAKEAGIAFAETAEAIKLLQASAESTKARVQTERQGDILKTEEIKSKNVDKQENIDKTHDKAMAKKEQQRLKGYDEKGKKKASAEVHEMIGSVKAYFEENSGGRIIADGVNMAAQGAAGAAKTIASGKMDVSGVADKATEALSKMGPYGAAAGALVQILKTAFEMYAKVDKAASDYARSVGGGRAAQDKMRVSAANLATEMSKWGETAYLAEEILERMGEASEKLGRNLEGLSTADLRSLKDLKNFGIEDDAIAQFDTFGVSVHNMSKEIADLYGEAGKKGLNAKATIKLLTSNLKMAQNYTFARGRKALADMALKAAQLKIDLKDAEQFANKVSTLEGAMAAGAQLSVLGGNFAMQGNPLAMMYNALNDVEGLQDQMLAMTKGLARWDSKKGQIDMLGEDRMRLKAVAESTGTDYNTLVTQAFNQARLERVSQQLGGGFTKDEENYIKNLASLDEKGNAYIQVGDKEYSMNDIRDNKDGVRTQLKSESEAKDTKEGADMGDLWSETRSIQDKLDDYIKWFQTKFMNVIVKMAAKVTGKDENALKYGFEGEDLKRYNKVKRFLDDKNLSQGELNRKIRRGAIDQEGIEMLQQMGVIDTKNQIIRNPSYERFSKNKTFSHAQVAEEIAKYNIFQDEQKKATGGFVSGKGGPTEDAIHARLSNGEFVVNAEATTRHRPLLERINSGVRNGSNLMKSASIATGISEDELRRGGSQKIDVSPIKIEFGTLTLQIGDLSRVLDSNEVASRLLNNSTFVDNIVKEIGIRANFGYRKDDSSNKFLDSPFVRSF